MAGVRWQVAGVRWQVLGGRWQVLGVRCSVLFSIYSAFQTDALHRYNQNLEGHNQNLVGTLHATSLLFATSLLCSRDMKTVAKIRAPILIDWELMESKYWHDTDEDNSRKRRRQAEFLIHKFCPWTLVKEIDVINNDVKIKVQKILQYLDNQPVVKRHYDWYY